MAARTLRTTARACAESERSAVKPCALKPFAVSPFTPASRRAWLRATRASWKPSRPKRSATAVEMPGPNPAIMIVLLMVGAS